MVTTMGKSGEPVTWQHYEALCLKKLGEVPERSAPLSYETLKALGFELAAGMHPRYFYGERH